MNARKLRIVGFSLFALAFFLPSVGGIEGPTDTRLPGWMCAYYSALLGVSAVGTLIPPYDRAFHDVFGPWLLLFSGSASPLTLVYVLAYKQGEVENAKVRRIFAVVILLGVVTAWIFLAVEHYEPLIGHYLWVIGILLILAPEVKRGTSNAEPTDLSISLTDPIAQSVNERKN